MKKYKLTAKLIGSDRNESVKVSAYDMVQALDFGRKEFIAKQVGIFEIIEVKKYE